MKKILAFFLAFVLLALLPLVLLKIDFFVVNKPVKSNILIIEGWLSSFAVDHPPFDYNAYDTIFVVGIKKVDRWHEVDEIRKKNTPNEARNYLRFPTNGYLFLRNYEQKNLPDSISNIRVVARGTKADGEFAHFFVSIKDSMVGHTFVHEQSDTFIFPVKVTREHIPYLNLYFNNDRLTKTEDINFRVYKVMLDSFSFLPNKDECFYLRKNLTSEALKTASYLISKSEIESEIILIDTLFSGLNNTLASARAINNYFSENSVSLNTVNIYTHRSHSRRTKLAYEKALPKHVKVGTIATSYSSNERFHSSGTMIGYLAIWDELISWLGTHFSFSYRNH
jgi:hypothetical protein